MPSLSVYNNLHKGTVGSNHKSQSDKIMDYTWWNDINSRVGYLYDYYHDSNKTQLNDLNSSSDAKKIPIDIKFMQASSQTYSKDAVTFHIQLRPGQECNVNYYDEFFGKRYGSIFPIGLYIDIEDEQGKYNRWLVVDKANYNVTQFPTFEVLRCDKVIQYIYDGTKFNVPAVLRSQNSYNSGIWTDYLITSTEDQQKFAMPLNRDTEHIFYNMRMIIDGAVVTEPRAWHISKVNRTSPYGILCATLAQDSFDQHKDYIELDNDGNVIGMWANYYSEGVLPEDYTDDTTPTLHAELSYAGKPEIKIGGSVKTLTVTFYSDTEEIPAESGTWEFYVNDTLLTNTEIETTVTDNKCKAKLITKDLSYIGKILTVKFESISGIKCQTDLEIRRL